MRMAAYYDQDQKEPFSTMKKVLINFKLRECMLSSWHETMSLLPHVSIINLILGLPFNGNIEQIGNTDK